MQKSSRERSQLQGPQGGEPPSPPQVWAVRGAVLRGDSVDAGSKGVLFQWGALTGTTRPASPAPGLESPLDGVLSGPAAVRRVLTSVPFLPETHDLGVTTRKA